MKRLIRLCIVFGSVLLMVGCGLRQPTLTRVNEQFFVVAHPFVYTTEDRLNRIEVPAGFLTDLASIPRAVWWFASPFEAAAGPAIIHDYLYWTQACTKEEADLVMYNALDQTGIGNMRRESIYFAVRTLPQATAAWNENAAAKAKGESRFLSPDYAKKLRDADIRPGLKLSTVYAEAGPNATLKPLVHPEVKKTCVAAIKLRDGVKDL